MTRTAAGPHLGVAVAFRPGDEARVPHVLARLDTLGVRLLKATFSCADLDAPDGLAWCEGLFSTLAGRAEVLPCLDGLPSRSATLDEFVDRVGHGFDWIELRDAAGGSDPRSFAASFERAASRLHALGRRVVLGGVSPHRLGGLEGVALECADAVGIAAIAAASTGWSRQLDAVRKLLEAGGTPRPLWITEAGFSTWRHDEAGQARELLALLDAPAARVYWCALDDLPAEVPAPEGFRHDQAGLFRADGSQKLAARALAAGGREAIAATLSLAAPRVRTAAPRVVVTGGAGFLGANLVDRLAGDGDSILVLDSLARPGVEENLSWLIARHRHRVAAEIADVRDPHVVRDAVKGASAVIHLAAQVAVTTSLADPVADFEVNGRGTLNVLEAVRHAAPDAPVLFASTNKVYGELIPRAEMVREGERYLPRDADRRRGIGEAHPLSFHSPYGCSKGVADQYVLDYARVYGLKTVVLRMSCLYGPHQFGTEDQGWVAHFLIAALAGRPLTVFGDGFQVRDVLYVDDAVAAYRHCLKGIGRTSGNAFNLGGGPDNALSLRELIAMIPEICGVTPVVSFDDWRPGDQAWYVSDTSALAAATGWRAAVPARDGIARLAAWLAGRFPAAAEAAAREVVA